jgi:hypothetical protein
MISSIGPLFYPGTFVDPTSNIFRATVNNLWSNPANWSYARVPLTTDRARIRALCVVDINNAICNELIVDNGFVLNFNSAATLTAQSIINTGIINVTTSSIFTFTGNNTRNTTWGTFNFGTAGTMIFDPTAGTTITIPNLDYWNCNLGMGTAGTGARLFSFDITIRNNSFSSRGSSNITNRIININNQCRWGGSSVTVINTSTINAGDFFAFSDNNESITNSTLNIKLNSSWNCRAINFYGTNNYVNIENGLSLSQNPITTWQNVNFTIKVNDQSITGTSSILLKSLTIEDKVLTQSTNAITVATINGTTATSKIINKANITYTGQPIPMITGILDLSSFVNTFNYVNSTNQTIKPITYWNLGIGSSVATDNTKTFTSNTLVLGNFTTTNRVILDFTGYNLTVNGTTTATITGGSPTYRSTGNSYLLFKGNFTGTNSPSTLNFTGTGITVEFQNGNQLINNSTFGTALVKATTNNQTWRLVNTSRHFIQNLQIEGIVLTYYSDNNGGADISGIVTGISGGSLSLFDKTRFTLTGATPFVNCIVAGALNSGMTYSRAGVQTIASGTYGFLTSSGTGVKTLLGNVILNGSLTANTDIECSTYNLTVTGTTLGNGTSRLLKSGAGSLIFIGAYGDANSFVRPSWTGNPSVEFRGGYINTNNADNIFGTGLISFTTKNQVISCRYQATMIMSNVNIAAGITVTLTNLYSNPPDLTVDVLNGLGTFTNNSGILKLRGASAQLLTPMASGTFNNIGGTLGYVSAFSATLPLGSYIGLIIAGGGIKTLSQNTTLTGNLLCDSTLECSTYNLTINGATNGNGTLSKTGSGNLLFIGRFIGDINLGGLRPNFTGNPNVEFRGGISVNKTTAEGANFGSGIISFTTNNQTITVGYRFEMTLANILISDNIFVSIASGLTMNIGNSLNGLGANAKLINISNELYYNGADTPMLTGLLDVSTNLNTFRYIRNGSQNVKGTTYRNLVLSGTATPNNKTLQGNVSVVGTYTVSGNAVRVDNGFIFSNP